jgi:hypothetical protein
MFRIYWILVLVGFLVMLFVGRFKPRWLRNYLSISLLSLGFSLALFYLFGLNPDYFRSFVNDFRVGSIDATTIIQPYVEGPQPWVGAVNNLLVFAFLFVPLPLLFIGGWSYALIFLCVSFLWFTFSRAYFKASSAGHMPTSSVKAFYFLLSFVAVQSIFEPDFGSALRHLSPLMPLMLVAISQPNNQNLGRRTVE